MTFLCYISDETELGYFNLKYDSFLYSTKLFWSVKTKQNWQQVRVIKCEQIVNKLYFESPTTRCIL